MLKKLTAMLMLFNIISCSVIPTTKVDNKPETPNNTIIYYGRTLLDGEMLKAYDFIRKDINVWEDNADALGSSRNQKDYTLYDNDIKLTLAEFQKVVAYLAMDLPFMYTMFSNPRYQLNSEGFVTIGTLQLMKSPNRETYLADMARIDEIANNLLKEITPEMSEFEKVKRAFDALMPLVSYGGTSSANSGNIKGAFIEGKIVCEGYAYAFLYLLQKLGIFGIYIVGNAQQSAGNSVLHAWNKVQIDGQWYNVDSTWSDGMLGTPADFFHYQNFLLSDHDFNNVNGYDSTHTPDLNAGYSVLPASPNTYPMSR